MSGEPVGWGVVVIGPLQPSSKLSGKMDMQADFWKMSWFLFEGKNGKFVHFAAYIPYKFHEILDEIHLDWKKHW